MEFERSLNRILLVDDTPNDRLLIARELKHEFPQIQIQEAIDWSGVEQALVADQFDFVITDYALNWATGLDILYAVKAHDPDLPIVMFTSSGTQEVAVEAMKAGLDDYVIKSPKHFVRLRQVIRSVWQNAQVRRKAAELEFRFQFLLNELNIGVFRRTLEGSLLEVSDGLLQLLKMDSLAEVQTFLQTHLVLQVPDDQARSNQHNQEIQFDSSSGVRWLQISSTLVPRGAKTFVDGLVIDITESKQTAAALRSLNQTLEQRVAERTARLEFLNQELEAFALSLSHDLQTPVRQIEGLVSLLKPHLESITDDETVLYYLQQIDRLSDRAGRMINDLLQFSRTGRAEIRYATVNMEQLVQEIKQQVVDQLAGRPIQWKIESLLSVNGDCTLLRQVWQNLIDNAVKYTRLSESAEIQIGSQLRDNETIFFVRDNGIGFGQNESHRLFGIFQRLTNADTFEGTGIGLANVQRVIRSHRGRVWAEGELHKGATFYFSLPCGESH